MLYPLNRNRWRCSELEVRRRVHIGTCGRLVRICRESYQKSIEQSIASSVYLRARLSTTLRVAAAWRRRAAVSHQALRSDARALDSQRAFSSVHCQIYLPWLSTRVARTGAIVVYLTSYSAPFTEHANTHDMDWVGFVPASYRDHVQFASVHLQIQ